MIKFSVLLFSLGLLSAIKLLSPSLALAQTCTVATVDKTLVKANETIRFDATSSSTADGFYFEIRNMGNPDGSGGYKKVCVKSGGDINTPSADCPVGTYPLMFKDNNTTPRTTGSRTLLAGSELFSLRDYGIYPINGSSLQLIQIVAYVQNGSGPLSPINPNCTVQSELYRPAVCSSASISGNILTPTQPLLITINGTPPAGTTITSFTLGFYNEDNLYPPPPVSNAKPIYYNGQHYIITVPNPNPSTNNSYTFTVNYNDLNRPDENWNYQYPINISTGGYFTLSDSGFSRPEAQCGTTFTLQAGNVPTPTTPAAGPTPTIPPPAWHSPDGQICNDNNYIVYYTGTDCTNTNPADKSYSVKDFTPQGQCSDNGTGKCFQVAGNPVNRLTSSYWQFDNQACTAVTVPYSPANTYDTLYDCLFAIPPVATISGQVTLDFISKNQFNKVFIWLNDVREKFLRNIEIPKNTIQSGQPFNYQFNNLFPDRKYDVYVLTYGVGGIVLENVEYMGSCQSPACRLTPPGIVDFTVKFLPPPAGSSTYLSSNVAFQDFINKWRAGQIGPIEMSQFIDQLLRVPGLQKAICDPLVPDGCRFIP